MRSSPAFPCDRYPFEQSQAIVAHWRNLLAPGTILVQFTYALYGPLRHLTDGFLQRASDIAWRNFPPARVVSLEVA